MSRLMFCKTGESNLGIRMYMDASFANDVLTSCSTSGFVIMLGGAAVSCCQSWVALSTAKAKANAAIEAIHKAKWLTNLINSMTKDIASLEQIIGLDIHNNSAVHDFVKRNGLKRNAHHAIVHMQYLKESALDGFNLVSIISAENIADMFTKALDAKQLNFLSEMMGMVKGKCNQANAKTDFSPGECWKQANSPSPTSSNLGQPLVVSRIASSVFCLAPQPVLHFPSCSTGWVALFDKKYGEALL